MQLYLDSYGAFLGVRNEMFWVKPLKNEATAIAVRNVNAIFLTKGVRVSSDAMLLALKNDIPMLLIDEIGRPVGQVWGAQYGSIATIRKNQAIFSRHEGGWTFVRDILIRKINNQRTFLEHIAEIQENSLPFKRRWQSDQQTLNYIVRNFQTWTFDPSTDPAGTFRGWEGTATRHYYRTLSLSLPEKYQFPRRSNHPAEDSFNALLNYLYGMLYVQVHLALLKAGLDPFMGILHADQYNRPTLVYDFIESYRIWAEQTAFNICRMDLLSPESFIQKEEAGTLLQNPGKGIVIETFLKFLDQKEEINGVLRKRTTHIDLDAQRLSGQLKIFPEG